MTCLGVLERGEQGDGNETGLKEGGGIEMSIYSAPFAMLALFCFEYLPCKYFMASVSGSALKSPNKI